MQDEKLIEAIVRTEDRAKSNSHRIERLESETTALHRIAPELNVLESIVPQHRTRNNQR